MGMDFAIAENEAKDYYKNCWCMLLPQPSFINAWSYDAYRV